MDARRLFWNQWTILGSTMGNDAEFAAVTNELREGRLMPPIDSVFDISQGREAFARLQSGAQFGVGPLQRALLCARAGLNRRGRLAGLANLWSD